MQYEGKRYVSSLLSDNDPSCYKDFFETDTFEEAKSKADEKSEKTNKPALVYDRKLSQITYKKEIIKPEVIKPEVIKPKKSGKKKEAPKKKNIYFED